jgi:5-methylcytosine-specific restriction endonuclease McrA
MSGGCCSICGYKKNYSALQFHHLNPEDKVFNLDGRKLSNTNWESIKKEWEKCQLLCSNCHAEIHNPDKEMKG